MRNLKKVLVLVLCFAMILGLMVVGAGAAFTDQDSIDSKHTEAVDMCVALHIIDGIPQNDGTVKFDPTGNVTREQMAKMICVLDNGGKEPQGSPGTTFSDVAADRWSNKFIEACAARGVVAGVGGGKFDPEGNVTGSQAAKMLLVELGYNQDIAKYTGAGWDTNVNIDATKKGYYDDLEDIDVSAPLSREHAAQMIWNALQAAEVEYSYTLVTNPDGSISSVVTVGDKTFGPGADSLMTDKYNTLSDEDSIGILTGISYNTTKEKWTYTLTDIDANGATDNVGSFTTDKDYTDLLGHNVHFVAKAADDVYGAYAQDSKVAVEGLFGDIGWDDFEVARNTGVITGSIEVDDTDYDFDANAAVYMFVPGFNKADGLSAQQNALVRLGRGPMGLDGEGGMFEMLGLSYSEFVAIDNDDNDDINVLIIYPTTLSKVTYVASDYVKAAGVDIEGDTYGTTSFDIEKDNQYTTYDGIAKDDYATITADRTLKTYGSFTNVEVQTGEVSSVTKDSISIDGTAYDMPTYMGESVPTEFLATLLAKEFDYITINGYVAMLDGTTSTDMSDFVLALSAGAGSSSGKTQVDVMDIEGNIQTLTVKGIYDADDNLLADQTIIAGMLYTYEQDGNYYKLTPITDDDVADFDVTGYDVAENIASYEEIADIEGASMIASDKGKANAKVGFGENQQLKFAEDGAFFVYDDGDWSVKKGSDLAKITDVNDATVLLACAEEDSNGYQYVTYGVIMSEGVVSSDWSYGIVVSDVSLSGSTSNGSGTFSIWNGTQEIELTTAKRDTATDHYVAKEAVIAYTTNADGKVDKIVNFTIGEAINDTGADANGMEAVVAAVVACDSDGNVILAYDDDGSYDTSIDEDDTTVIFYDFEKNNGESGSTVSKASEADPAEDYGVEYNDSYYFYNVLYVANSTATDPLVLVVVDTAGDLASNASWMD